MKQSLEFLKDRITDKMPLEDMVEIFEDLCSVPIEDEMILFETGAYSAISNKPLFQLSLVRQAPNEDEEFYQVHLDIFYEASQDNQIFSEATWDEDIEENIFDYIRASDVFAYAKKQEYLAVNIYLDET
ncbi:MULTISPECIES: hypothetical protein [Streptococcus]|jgi:hypothetical protein|uniref:Uncharacterized protein n=1 Tax=Streptococcus parasanguinis TaxID=1318 RepID=A0A6N3CNU7_STRPA|nr:MULTISPECIES: hypothetical protein [Streptococcus]MBS6719473.1 hypothetical protein [Streptococcus parasanguinis]MBT0907105.1 hypothetical protein [Streptococcus parasanguinis]MBT0926891.1 hypothetical protein [Streptococcus parasanguinis]MCP9043245.1 hypothetical protein [Streptococcus sp. CF8_Ac1-11]